MKTLHCPKKLVAFISSLLLTGNVAFAVWPAELGVKPENGPNVNQGVKIVYGFADDPAGVGQILYSVNSEDAWQPVTAKTNTLVTVDGNTGETITVTEFSVPVTLIPGTNYIYFKSFTPSGALSATCTKYYYYSPTLKAFETVAPGGTLTIHLGNPLPLDTTFQWQFNEADIPGATSADLTIANATKADEGRYRVIINGYFGSFTSSETALELSSLVLWGITTGLQPPPGLTDIRSIAMGNGFIVALRSNGTCVAWGNWWVHDAPEVTNVPPDLTNVVSIAANGGQTLALKDDGTVVWWGYRQNFDGVMPDGLTNIVGVACGLGFCVVLKDDGTVIQWRTSGSPSVVYDRTAGGISNVVAIAAHAMNWIALKKDGTVVEYFFDNWALTPHPHPEITNAVSVGCGANHALVVNDDGTVTAVRAGRWDIRGWDVFGELDVPQGLTDVVAVTGGWNCSYAVKNDKSVVAWGAHSLAPYDQCGVPPGMAVRQMCNDGWCAAALVDPSPRVSIMTFTTNQKPDHAPPTVTVQTPRQNGHTTSATLTGFCNDNASIAHIWCTTIQNGVPVQTNDITATGTVAHTLAHKWTFSQNLSLQPGINTITVRAQDAWGNKSSLVTKTFHYDVPTPFNLSITGNGVGKVILQPVGFAGTPITLISTGTGATATPSLYLGETYKLKAIHAIGSTFQGWTGLSSTTATPITFTAVPGMTVQATFTKP